MWAGATGGLRAVTLQRAEQMSGGDGVGTGEAAEAHNQKKKRWRRAGAEQGAVVAQPKGPILSGSRQDTPLAPPDGSKRLCSKLHGAGDDG